jgi:hypothetical protein
VQLKWTRPGAPQTSPDPPPGLDSEASVGFVCKGLKKALERVFRLERPEILNLGPLCGDSVIFLAGKGARVHVDEFVPPPPPEPRSPGKPATKPVPVRLLHPGHAFDMVLVWDLVDFTPPESLPSVGPELARILKPGGWLVMLSQANRAGRSSPGTAQEQYARPGLYRILDDSQVAQGDVPGSNKCRRWVHPNRDLEKAIAPLRIQNTHLLRNQLREYTAILPG